MFMRTQTAKMALTVAHIMMKLIVIMTLKLYNHDNNDIDNTGTYLY